MRIMIKVSFFFLFLNLLCVSVWGYVDSRVRSYVKPVKLVWQKDGDGTLIENTDVLLKGGDGQAVLNSHSMCVMKSSQQNFSSILLDFGKELHGGISIVTGLSSTKEPIKIKVTFGESVSEAMSTIGDSCSATNDHAMREFEVGVSWLGSTEVGQTGFRFVRIDLLQPGVELCLKEINAVTLLRDIPYRGSFMCNDELLNQIWKTGAYTVHLNMQNYLWDGIKRDRLVWVGDMFPEVMTVNSVFGYNEIVPKSLDLARDSTPLPGWMNGISSYSLWWILIHKEWFLYQGDIAYLQEQKPYLMELVKILLSKVDHEGREFLDGQRFLDWPSEGNVESIDAGLQALLLMALDAGNTLLNLLGEHSLAQICKLKCQQMRQYPLYNLNDNLNKQAASLMGLAGLIKPDEVNIIISNNGTKGFSTFYGYYMLQAQAQANNYSGALDMIRSYWGGMLQMGATTFWEDFDVEWMENAGRIDEITPQGKKDIHADFGRFCYTGLRHSLCHGWASGPTASLTEHVLGVKVLEPGCRVLKIEPHLENLEWVKGRFPTPLGDVDIYHRKEGDRVITKIQAPKGVKVIKSDS